MLDDQLGGECVTVRGRVLIWIQQLRTAGRGAPLQEVLRQVDERGARGFGDLADRLVGELVPFVGDG